MGSGSMRAQLSLLFTDKELYENFIVPSKNNRMLHSIILKCLTAYYYNADVRCQIEGVEINNTEVENEHIKTQQESINNIRDILTMQGFLSESLKNTMEDGIDDFDDILSKVNQTAEDYGAMSSSKNEYGTTTVKLKVIEDKQMTTEKGNTEDNDTENVKEVVLPSSFMDTFKEMSEFMSFVKESGLINQVHKKEDKVEEIEDEIEDKEDKEEIEIKESVDAEDIDLFDDTETEDIPEPKKPVVKRGKKATKEEKEEKPIPVVAPPPIEETEDGPVLGEASDALSELLDSL